MPITLTHTGTTVEIQRFRLSPELPRRTRPESRVGLNLSYHGNAYPSGPRRSQESWQFTALVTEEQLRLLSLIDDKSQTASRTPPYTGFEIELVDTSKTLTEAVQTRAASGAVTNNADGSVTYTPVWRAMFEAPITDELTGTARWAICSLSEGSQTTP